MNKNCRIEWIDETETNKKRYDDILKRVSFSNIPQSWDYGIVKIQVDGGNVFRGIIQIGETDVGVIQVLLKRKYGIPVAVRVNRGPLLLEEYDTVENQLNVINIVRNHIPHPLPVSYAPNIESRPQNLKMLTRFGWRQWDIYGYETGLLDLTVPLTELRSGLDSKWRNQLKTAEKYQLFIMNNFERFDEITSIYEESQREKGYKGISKNILYGLIKLDNNPLDVFYLTNNEDKIIAFDIFYHTDNFGLYLVGWNDNEGRKMYANNFLLYHAACYYKERKVRWLDLGGIDYISTEDVARFKDGMRPKHVRYVGEFIRF